MKHVLCAVAVITLACSEPTPPSRAGTYGFAIGQDVFHWPPERPVRFYAQPASNLRFLVQRAIEAWAALFLYGEFEGTLVADSTGADVIVVWTDSVPPDVPPDPRPPFPACTGVTSLPAIDADSRFTGPLHIQLSVQSGFTEAQVQACMRRTAIHEVGHALGLFQHPDPGVVPCGEPTGSIMCAPPAVYVPSEQDRRTVEVLYHTPATVFPPLP